MVSITASSRVWLDNAVPKRKTRTLAVVRLLIVRSLSFVLLHRDHTVRHYPVAVDFVGDQSSGDTALAFQQLAEEADGGSPIAPGLHEDVDCVAVLVYGTPQILQPPLDLDEQFGQMPGVALAATAAP
jgi:hypothetical protein